MSLDGGAVWAKHAPESEGCSADGHPRVYFWATPNILDPTFVQSLSEVNSYLKQSVPEVVFKNSIPTQIRRRTLS